MQLAMYSVCPFGERRQDLRQAYHTAHIMAASAMSETKPEQFMQNIDHLSSYLKCDSDEAENEFDPDALRLMKEKQCQG